MGSYYDFFVGPYVSFYEPLLCCCAAVASATTTTPTATAPCYNDDYNHACRDAELHESHHVCPHERTGNVIVIFLRKHPCCYSVLALAI